MSEALTQHQLAGFREAAQSLKLYRRAELRDERDRSLISELYVDPLPNQHVFQTLLRPDTTILIGRKGTGKSTVFQRVQYELRKMRHYTSAYIDIKTTYESSQVDPELAERIRTMPAALSPDEVERLLLYRAFLADVVKGIREEVERQLKESRWERLKDRFGGTYTDLFSDLDDLIARSSTANFVSIQGLIDEATSDEVRQGTAGSSGLNAEVGVGRSTEAKIGTTSRKEYHEETAKKTDFSQLLMQVFSVREYIQHLTKVLEQVGIRHLYVFVDDFSELPQDAMEIVVDSLLAPLNNWSNEVVKFKIAAYPGRVYYGSIDKTKIDEIHLDAYELYGREGVSTMEEKSIDFTRRLVEQRLHFYCGTNMAALVESRTGEDIWRLMFYASMANPRILGYLLFYLYESHLIYGNPIGSTAIREAARRYYEEKIEPYFAMGKFLHETFGERSSVYSLKELLEKIVYRARQERTNRRSVVMQKISGRPPTSHFHIVSTFEQVIASLELNFFISKYYEMSDRDGRKVSVFALNYGLCQKYSIEFGRPVGDRTFRLYFVERIFDYSTILHEYVQNNQEIVCDNCGDRFDVSELEALMRFDMLCPSCRSGTCKTVNLSRKYERLIEEVDPELLLPATEVGILTTLHYDEEPMFAMDIAGELDCSYQLVGARARTLAERGLLVRDRNAERRRVYSTTELAERSYFAENSSGDLDLEEPEDH